MEQTHTSCNDNVSSILAEGTSETWTESSPPLQPYKNAREDITCITLKTCTKQNMCGGQNCRDSMKHKTRKCYCAQLDCCLCFSAVFCGGKVSDVFHLYIFACCCTEQQCTFSYRIVCFICSAKKQDFGDIWFVVLCGELL